MSRRPSTLAAIQRAGEEARAANHAAYNDPARGTSAAYDRTGAIYDLLCKTEQLARVLGGHIRTMANDPALRSTDGEGQPRALAAADKLLAAAQVVASAGLTVNAAWNELSSLYLDDRQEATTP